MATTPRRLDPSIIVFSPELEQVISEVLPSDNPFGSPNFDPVDYINRQFPNEHSLGNLDGSIQNLKAEIRKLDEDILEAVRKQSRAGAQAKQDLAEGKAAMEELFTKIKLIREKSEQSEAVVQEIGRDIKVLDFAKRHLVTTITTLKRFNNLASAVEQLDGMATRRQYREAGSRLEAVNGLCQHFESFKNVPRVNELRDNVERMKGFLRRQILDEFTSVGSEDAAPPASLKDACEVVNALGPETRQEVILRFCTQQLAPYVALYQPPAEQATLDKTEQRYKWLRKQLKSYEAQYGKVFPISWQVSRHLCHEFCTLTRKHLLTMLEESRDKVDVSLMVRVLQRTIDFEHELTQRFSYHADKGVSPRGGDGSSEDGSDWASEDRSRPKSVGLHKGAAGLSIPEDLCAGGVLTAPDGSEFVFRGIISSSFEPYMGPYLDLVDKNMSKKLSELVREEKWVLADDSTSSNNKILNSSGDLFLYIRSSLKECSAFSRNQTLFNLLKLFKKYLKLYCEALNQKLPRVSAANAAAALLTDKEEQVRLSERDEQTVCLIINTADYCCETIGQLGDMIRRTIEKAYVDAVDVSNEQEDFSGVITKAVRILVVGMETKVQLALDQMTRMPWDRVDVVGDQSQYISVIGAILSASVPGLAALLSDTHFRFYTDKLVASLIPRYMISIYRCRRINETGAQQLQVDSHALRTLLLQIHTTAKHDIPPTYQKYVDKEMGRIETLLKVILTPADSLAETYWKLVPDGTAADFTKLLELKGLKSSGIKLPMLAPMMKGHGQPQGAGPYAGGGAATGPGSAAGGALSSLGGPMGASSSTQWTASGGGPSSATGSGRFGTAEGKLSSAWQRVTKALPTMSPVNVPGSASVPPSAGSPVLAAAASSAASPSAAPLSGASGSAVGGGAGSGYGFASGSGASLGVAAPSSMGGSTASSFHPVGARSGLPGAAGPGGSLGSQLGGGGPSSSGSLSAPVSRGLASFFKKDADGGTPPATGPSSSPIHFNIGGGTAEAGKNLKEAGQKMLKKVGGLFD